MAGTGGFLHGMQALFRAVREFPLVWLALGAGVAALALRVVPFRSRAPFLRRAAVAAGIFALALYAVVALASLHCFLLQDDEASILSIAGASLHGLPLYHAPASPDASYSLMYGPAMFLIYRSVLAVGGGDHFWFFRVLLVAANLGLFAALYALVRRFVSAAAAVALLALPAAVVLQFIPLSLGLRADSWILLCAALALLCSFWGTELAAALLVGVLCGIFINLKISAAPAALFPLLTLYRRFGVRPVLLAAVTMTAVALAPFALPNISLRNYLAWIALTKSEGTKPEFVFKNGLFELFLLAPCVAMELFARRHGRPIRERLPELAVILLCLLAAFPTFKPGSGPWYLWHIVPSILAYLALRLRDLENVPAAQRMLPLYLMAAGWAVCALLNFPRSLLMVYACRTTPQIAAQQAELNYFLDFYRAHDSVQMGYGSVPEDPRTLVRYLLVDKGERYTIDGSTGRFETSMVPFPANVLHRMQTCADDVWLVPHGQTPFDFYLFPPSVKQAFLAHYSIDTGDQMYDAYVCDPARSARTSGKD